MTKYWLFALIVHPIRATRMLWINKRQKPPAGHLIAVGRYFFQIDFKQYFHPLHQKSSDDDDEIMALKTALKNT